MVKEKEMGKDKFKQNNPKQGEPKEVLEKVEIQEVAEEPTKEPEKVEAAKPDPVTRKATVTGCDLLRVRTRPTTDAEVVRTIRRGTVIEVEVVKEGWAALPNGRGFVMEKFIKMNA